MRITITVSECTMLPFEVKGRCHGDIKRVQLFHTPCVIITIVPITNCICCNNGIHTKLTSHENFFN